MARGIAELQALLQVRPSWRLALSVPSVPSGLTMCRCAEREYQGFCAVGLSGERGILPQRSGHPLKATSPSTPGGVSATKAQLESVHGSAGYQFPRTANRELILSARRRLSLTRIFGDSLLRHHYIAIIQDLTHCLQFTSTQIYSTRSCARLLSVP